MSTPARYPAGRVSRRVLLGLLAAGTVSLLAACAPSVPPTATAPAAASKPVAVKAAWIGLTANQMLWPLAKDAGYFDKYGVNLELVYVQGSGTAVQALIGGELQAIQAAGSAVVSGRAAKQDVVMTAGFQNEIGWKVCGVDSIKSVDDLKGKTVAVSKVGNSDYFAWTILAKKQGWQPEDFKFLNANDAPGQVTMLESGNAQATAISPPNEVLAQRHGAHIVLDTARTSFSTRRSSTRHSNRSGWC
jgi:NitT/TauT family transport system substrate-binding protein